MKKMKIEEVRCERRESRKKGFGASRMSWIERGGERGTRRKG